MHVVPNCASDNKFVFSSLRYVLCHYVFSWTGAIKRTLVYCWRCKKWHKIHWLWWVRECVIGWLWWASAWVAGCGEWENMREWMVGCSEWMREKKVGYTTCFLWHPVTQHRSHEFTCLHRALLLCRCLQLLSSVSTWRDNARYVDRDALTSCAQTIAWRRCVNCSLGVWPAPSTTIAGHLQSGVKASRDIVELYTSNFWNAKFGLQFFNIYTVNDVNRHLLLVCKNVLRTHSLVLFSLCR